MAELTAWASTSADERVLAQVLWSGTELIAVESRLIASGILQKAVLCGDAQGTVTPMPDDRPACRCVICYDYGDRGEADRLGLRTLQQVQDHGWSVVMVPADDEGPGFAYTIGLWHTHKVPELATFGLDVGTMHVLLNDLGRKAAAGVVLKSGEEYHNFIEGRPVVPMTADLRWYREFFGRAISFYRRPPFPLMQVVWPDAEGRFLWQPGVHEGYGQSQPRLWLKPPDHPEGVWSRLASS